MKLIERDFEAEPLIRGSAYLDLKVKLMLDPKEVNIIYTDADAIVAWLDSEFVSGPPWVFEHDNYRNCRFYLRDERDSVLFALRWLGTG